MATKLETAKVVSHEMTWVHGELELPAGQVVEIPADRLAEVLKLQGVAQVLPPATSPVKGE